MTAHLSSQPYLRWPIVSITAVLLMVGALAFVHNAAGSPSLARATVAPTPARPPTASVVLGLGDSVTAGSNCDCTDFIHLYAAGLPAAKGGPAEPINLGKGGSTSVDLLDDLRHDSTTKDDAARANIDVITIGANDLQPLLATWQASDCDNTCYDGATRAVGDRIRAIVQTIRNLRGTAPTTVFVTSYWNVFADGQVAREESGEEYLTWSDTLTQALNTQICSAAKATGSTCVDLHAPFKGNGSMDPTPLLADDGDHPNAAGHHVIATTLLAATKAALRP